MGNQQGEVPLPSPHRPHWQLPPGVSRGVWQYAQAEHIAGEYDAYFAQNRLFRFDEQVLARHFDRPGLVVDLGSGTGRTLIPLARRGFRGLAVDLSLPMLRLLGRKAADEHLPIARLRANLVQLDCLRDESADYCTCMFSTLGMIHGRQNRQRVLEHVQRILKPGGLFVLHAHNVWFGLFDSVSRAWLAGQLWCSLLGQGTELGDKFFDYRGIPKMYLHTFSQRELVRAVRRAGFRLKELIPLAVTRQRPLPHAWFFGSLRANGWIVVCEKPPSADRQSPRISQRSRPPH